MLNYNSFKFLAVDVSSDCVRDSDEPLYHLQSGDHWSVPSLPSPNLTPVFPAEKWAAVADICRCLHNFNGVLQVCAAFTNSAVFRLKDTWKRISKTVISNHQHRHHHHHNIILSVLCDNLQAAEPGV